MPPWLDWVWRTCPKVWRSPTLPRGVSSGCLKIGAFRIQAITSGIQAAGSPPPRLRCWSMRYATGDNPFSKYAQNGCTRHWPALSQKQESNYLHDRTTTVLQRGASKRASAGGVLCDRQRGEGVKREMGDNLSSLRQFRIHALALLSHRGAEKERQGALRSERRQTLHWRRKAHLRMKS
jgi:hypothetical protein